MFYSPQYPQKRELGVTPSKRSINIGWMKNKSLILNFNPAFITAANVILGQFLTCQHIYQLPQGRQRHERTLSVVRSLYVRLLV